jgi:hypothetical protein
MSLSQALQRPANHNELSAEAQWAIDKRLGILDWDPTPAEVAEYRRRRAAPTPPEPPKPAVHSLQPSELKEEAKFLLHECWSQATESPSYDKELWSRFSEVIQRFQASIPG